jgi:hypothetical protein
MIEPVTEDQLGVEPHLTAAFAVSSNPSAYALLLGAGVSISSGVPSAWGVQEALIERLARTVGDDTDDPFAWYSERFGKPSTYDGLLASLTHTQAERQALLRNFFEPTDEEREQGLKQPSLAHRAIARLVAAGLVRVILTINFDRLLETALRDEGIEPTVVATPADTEGLAPTHTQRCLVIHLHGDYLNPSGMLNTAEELGSYPTAVNELLDKVLSEHGLICSGWSATWDPALRAALSRNASRFYATYWVEPSALSAEAEDLRAQRQGTHVASTADGFFGALADACDAIRDTKRRHPLTAPIAAATAKRELAGATIAIPLHDVLHAELEKLRNIKVLTTTQFSVADSAAEHTRRRQQIETALEVPLTLVATCAYWGRVDTDGWWFDDISRFAVQPNASGSTALIHQRQFPATALLYAGGIASVAARRFDLTRRLLAEPTTIDRYSGDVVTVAALLAPDRTLSLNRSHRYLYNLLRPIFEGTLGLGEAAYSDASQRFEYLRLVQATYIALEAEGRDTEGASDESLLQSLREKARDPLDGVAARAAQDVVESERSAAERRQQRAAFVPMVLPHIFVTGRTNSHRATTARDLEAELVRDGDRHPLLRQHGGEPTPLCGGGVDSILSTMKDVDIRIDRVANDTAWSLGEGWIPSEFWIDDIGK